MYEIVAHMRILLMNTTCELYACSHTYCPLFILCDHKPMSASLRKKQIYDLQEHELWVKMCYRKPIFILDENSHDDPVLPIPSQDKTGFQYPVPMCELEP